MQNERIERLLARIREAGFELRLNWEAPRWRGDKGTARHYSVTDSADGRKPGVRTFVLIDYEGEGYGFYPESETVKIDDDLAAITGQADPIAWEPGEAEAIVRALEPQIRRVAAEAWAKHPRNPVNMDDLALSAELDQLEKTATVPGSAADQKRGARIALIRAEFQRRAQG